MWRDLPEDDKQEFIEEYEVEKVCSHQMTLRAEQIIILNFLLFTD